jgi:hypothetical protein
MIYLENVPVVVEPGVAAIEVDLGLASVRSKSPRSVFPAKLCRLDVTGSSLEDLPFIPSAKVPHVFSLAEKVEESVVLLTYDATGRLSAVYNRDETGRAWEARPVAAENAGATIMQSSIRYIFSSANTRDRAMMLHEKITEAINSGETPSKSLMLEFFTILARLRVPPVVLPVAVHRAARKQVKL